MKAAAKPEEVTMSIVGFFLLLGGSLAFLGLAIYGLYRWIAWLMEV
jgi:hypothetical protein